MISTMSDTFENIYLYEFETRFTSLEESTLRTIEVIDLR